MGRGLNKGKRGGRGGSRRSYVTSLEDMEARNNRESAWNSRKNDGDESGSDEGVEESKNLDEYDSGAAEAAFAKLKLEEQNQVRFKGAEGVIEIENPNLSSKGNRNIKIKNLSAEAEPVQLTRKEKEAIEQERKKQQYLKLHAAGKTEEAKSDVERLNLVRARREEQAKKNAEASAALTDQEKRRKAAMASKLVSDESGDDSREEDNEDSKKTMKQETKAVKKPAIEKLNTIEVKKMNPTKIKELLKERGESVQGSKKELMARLLDW
eukprot:CAMPEP_0171463506 /NCGR_PEP_ID=MMETSP0945-20130129/7154_1 /TAXON_ID=109269 /ORGANISM="Vaucheria litorea, Strain CCMP2940" /LENGTH=266 /DNA_ID=CAMNT_0011990321 /DNA_START=42 /DNA_END=839 /DNA_ORIENTATION=-